MFHPEEKRRISHLEVYDGCWGLISGVDVDGSIVLGIPKLETNAALDHVSRPCPTYSEAITADETYQATFSRP